MLKLINMAREKGMTPVMTNNYTRNDYTAADYGYIKRINMLIHEWDLPTINLLGAIDDGAGRWASGYWQDGLHPNDAGHAEFAYSMVPSMFDALEAGKPLPVRAKNNAATFSNGSSADQLLYLPDNLLHSFTHSFEFKTNAAGVLSTMKTTGAISLDATTGNLVYTSPVTGSKITGNTALHDNQWHRVTLTHYYARGLTLLYVDSTLVGQKSEKMAVDIFRLNDLSGPAEVSFRDWFLYRAGMNREEIAAICAGRMLKSGLELYAPLYTQGENQFENKAQSTTLISKVRVETSGYSNYRLTGTSIFPNPVDKNIHINGLKTGNLYHFRIFNTLGQLTFSGKIEHSNQINVAHLPKGQYLIEIFDSKSFEKASMRFAKL